MSRRRSELLILAALIVALVALRFSLHCGSGPYGVDGSYYLQVARSVAEGRGLMTHVDLYHQGLDPLPAPTNIYPLWPLLLGGTARLIGMTAAVHHVSRVLYVVTLLLLYACTRKITERQSVAGPFNAAHLVVLLFGLNSLFFDATTFPYTEGLAFTMATAALLSVFRDHEAWRFVTGVLTGLALLTRSQMLVLAIAIGIALVLAAYRARDWKPPVLFAVGTVITVGPWLVWMTTFARPFSLSLIWASYHQTAAVPAYPLGYPTATALEWLVVRLRGLGVMFRVGDSNSFVALFGAAAFLVPLALLHWIVRVRRERPVIAPPVLAVVLAGSFLSFMLLLTPQQFFRMWLFGWRHGLPLIFLIAVSLVELVAFGKPLVRGAAVLLTTISIVAGAADVIATVRRGPPRGLSPVERQLTSWLDENARGSIVLTTNAQVLAPYSHASFRWATCAEPAHYTRAILDHVRTDYVALYERERDCAFVRGLGDELAPAVMFGRAPNRIMLLRNRQ